MDREKMDEKRAAIMAVLREAGHEMPEPRRRRKVRRVASGGNSRFPIPQFPRGGDRSEGERTPRDPVTVPGDENKNTKYVS